MRRWTASRSPWVRGLVIGCALLWAVVLWLAVRFASDGSAPADRVLTSVTTTTSSTTSSLPPSTTTTTTAVAAAPGATVARAQAPVARRATSTPAPRAAQPTTTVAPTSAPATAPPPTAPPTTAPTSTAPTTLAPRPLAVGLSVSRVGADAPTDVLTVTVRGADPGAVLSIACFVDGADIGGYTASADDQGGYTGSECRNQVEPGSTHAYRVEVNRYFVAGATASG